MEVTTNNYKHCDLITVKGRVDSATASKLAEALEASNTSGVFRLVLDLKGVDFMSSAGFRVLLAGQRTCKRYNRGEIVLSGVTDRVKDALELAGFNTLFTMFEDTTAAVGHF